MVRTIYRAWAAAFVVLCLSMHASAELSTRDKSAIQQVRSDLQKAGVFFRANNIPASALALRSAKARLNRLPNNPEVQAAAKSLHSNLQKAELLLQQRGGLMAANLVGPDTEIKEGEVRFSESIAGVLQSQCARCHGGDAPRGRLRLESFAEMMQGGKRGPILQPGRPGMSRLVGKLKGSAEGDRMPLEAEPLSDELIRTIETWIKEGAKYDAADPTVKFSRLAETAKTSKMSDQELDKSRESMAVRNWRLAFPKKNPNIFPSESFLIVGDLPDKELQEIGSLAEAAKKKSAKILKLKDTEFSTQGRVTIFVTRTPYDYVEFGQMVEKRKLPEDALGHWQSRGSAGYIVLGPEPTKEAMKPGTHLAMLVTSVMANSWGAPQWFADGIGGYVAEKIDRRDVEVRSWPDKAKSAIPRVDSGESILKSELPPESASVVNWAFTRFLLSQDIRRSTRLLQGLAEGASFERAFAMVFNSKPEMAAQMWLRRNGGGPKRRN